MSKIITEDYPIDFVVSWMNPYDENWTVYLDKAVFTYFNEEYSKRWSTFGKNPDEYPAEESPVSEVKPLPAPQPKEGAVPLPISRIFSFHSSFTYSENPRNP